MLGLLGFVAGFHIGAAGMTAAILSPKKIRKICKIIVGKDEE